MAINVLYALTIGWNILIIVVASAFAYFGFVVRDDLITQRYPAISLIQLVCLWIWGNFLVQLSGLHLVYESPLPALVPWFWHCLILPANTLIYATCFAIRGLSLTLDLFATKKLVYEAQNKKEFDWKQHLTPLEQLFFRVQAKVMRSHRVLAARRYSSSAQRRAVLVTFFLAILQALAGMLWAGCFDPAIGFDHCTDEANFHVFFHIVNAFFLVSGGVFVILFFMLRDLHGPLYLREEMLFLFVWMMGIYSLYLANLYFGLPRFTDPTQFLFPVLVGMWVTMIPSHCIPIIKCMSKLVMARRALSSLTRSEEDFQRLLKDKHLFEELKKTMTATFSLENGLFWEELTSLERYVAESKVPPEQIQGDLQRLYTEYVECGAPRELNLTSGIRGKVTADYRANRLTLQSFAGVRKEVYLLMLSNSYPQLIRELKSRAGSLQTTRRWSGSH